MDVGTSVVARELTMACNAGVLQMCWFVFQLLHSVLSSRWPCPWVPVTHMGHLGGGTGAWRGLTQAQLSEEGNKIWKISVFCDSAFQISFLFCFLRGRE